MKEKKNTVWTRNFIILFISAFIINFGQSMVNNLLPKYLDLIGLTSTAIGFIISLFSFTALGFRPVSGPLIDGWNKKKLYMIMLVILIAAYGGYVLMPPLPVIVICRLLHGLGQGCISALALTMATDAVPPEKIASGLSLYGIGGVLAGALGPGLGITIMEKYGYSYAFSAPLALLIIALAMSVLLENSYVPGTKIRFTLSGMICKESILPSVLVLLAGLIRGGIYTFLIIFMSERGIGNIVVDLSGHSFSMPGMSAYYYLNALVMIITRPFFGALADKKGLHIALIPSYVFFAVSLVATAFCQNTSQLMLVAVLNALGFGTVFASAQALCMKVAPVELRGAASTTSFIGLDIGDLLGPIICGALVDIMGCANMFLTMLVPVILSVVLLFAWLPKNIHLVKPDAAG